MLVDALRSRQRLSPRLGDILYHIAPEDAVQAWADIVSAPGDLETRRQALWPLGIDLLAQLAMALAFCGYMAAGVRPNAYYRRRLPTA